MKDKAKHLVWLAGLVTLLASASGAVLLAEATETAAGEAFQRLAPQTDVVYLLANSSLIVGPDQQGPAEDITFTGTVHVPKYPAPGFARRKLPSGRFQIDFELTESQLDGESYLMSGPVHLGEHPDLRSLGTITQDQVGKDYPADFIVQRKVLIETPKGQLYNEEPVPVRGTIDSIPPVRNKPDGKETNVFRGKELPIALLDQQGNLAGWFYSTVHVAYAVDPVAIYRVPVSGTITLKVGDEEEAIQVEGPVEFLEQASDRGSAEMVKMALRGTSKLLDGPVMFTESFHPERKFSRGNLGTSSQFDLYFEIKTPAGNLMVEEPVRVKGNTGAPQKIDHASLGAKGDVPVYAVAFNVAGDGGQEITDDAGTRLGVVSRVNLSAERVAGHRPCCPVGKATAKSAKGSASR